MQALRLSGPGSSPRPRGRCGGVTRGGRSWASTSSRVTTAPAGPPGNCGCSASSRTPSWPGRWAGASTPFASCASGWTFQTRRPARGPTVARDGPSGTLPTASAANTPAMASMIDMMWLRPALTRTNSGRPGAKPRANARWQNRPKGRQRSQRASGVRNEQRRGIGPLH